MRVIVAGGAGFIGSHLCARLLQQGDEVVCIDNLVTGRRSNITALLGCERFSFIEHDLISGVPKLGSFDRVYHLASPASPVGYQRYAIETLRVNSDGTRHLLDAAVESGARFLYTSTSEVYGDPLEHPQREEYRGNVSSIGPRSMYDEAKRYGEALIMAYVRHKRADARIVRIFNTYGPHSDPDDGRLVPNFIKQALLGRPLEVYGDGSQTRSLCFVKDLVGGLVLAMESEAARGEVINLGNPEEHCVLDFAYLVQRLTRTTSGISYTDPAVGDDPKRRRPDITKAKQLLGWAPETGLEDGLGATIEDIRATLGAQARGRLSDSTARAQVRPRGNVSSTKAP
jgi:nucleoside-diphosphate-sugar epimerase